MVCVNLLTGDLISNASYGQLFNDGISKKKETGEKKEKGEKKGEKKEKGRKEVKGEDEGK